MSLDFKGVSNAFGPVIAGLLVHRENPITYPLYLSGILTLIVLGVAIATRRQYAVTTS